MSDLKSYSVGGRTYHDLADIPHDPNSLPPGRVRRHEYRGWAAVFDDDKQAYVLEQPEGKEIPEKLRTWFTSATVFRKLVDEAEGPVKKQG